MAGVFACLTVLCAVLLGVAMGLYFYEANKIRTWTEEWCVVTDVQQFDDLRWVPPRCLRYNDQHQCVSWRAGYYKSVYWYVATIELEMHDGRRCVVSEKGSERDVPTSGPPVGKSNVCWGNTEQGERCPTKTQWTAPNVTHRRRFFIAMLILCPTFFLAALVLCLASAEFGCCEECE